MTEFRRQGSVGLAPITLSAVFFISETKSFLFVALLSLAIISRQRTPASAISFAPCISRFFILPIISSTLDSAVFSGGAGFGAGFFGFVADFLTGFETLLAFFGFLGTFGLIFFGLEDLEALIFFLEDLEAFFGFFFPRILNICCILWVSDL